MKKIVGDKILVQEQQKEQSGSIILPETASSNFLKEGVIIDLGSGALTFTGEIRPFQVKKNDRVLYDSGSGIPIEIDGEKYVLMKEDGIIAVL